MPQIETRVILVQEAGKQEELIKALKVWRFSFLFFLAKLHCMQDLISLIKPTPLAVEAWNCNH